MSLVAGALKGRGTVLTMRDEFPSSTLARLNAGFNVKFLKPGDGRQDLEALGRLCHRRGVIFVVNNYLVEGLNRIGARTATPAGKKLPFGNNHHKD
jgi:hypothetical protein